MSYSDLVERIKKLSVEEQEELKVLLEKLLIEARREEILRHYDESKAEAEGGKLTFRSDIDELQSPS
jgi:hypothetical protein